MGFSNAELDALLKPLGLAHHAAALAGIGFSVAVSDAATEQDLVDAGLTRIQARAVLAEAARKRAAPVQQQQQLQPQHSPTVWGARPSWVGPAPTESRLVVRATVAPSGGGEPNGPLLLPCGPGAAAPLVQFSRADIDKLKKALSARGGVDAAAVRAAVVALGGLAPEAAPKPQPDAKVAPTPCAVAAKLAKGLLLGAATLALAVAVLPVALVMALPLGVYNSAAQPRLESRRQARLAAALDALNTDVLEPAGMYAQFGTLLSPWSPFNGERCVAAWLAVATTKAEAAALRKEPCFWLERPPPDRDSAETLTVAEVHRRATADPRVPDPVDNPERLWQRGAENDGCCFYCCRSAPRVVG